MLIAAWSWAASSSTVTVWSPIATLSPPSSCRRAVSRASGPLRISRPTSRETGPANAITIAATMASSAVPYSEHDDQEPRPARPRLDRRRCTGVNA